MYNKTYSNILRSFGYTEDGMTNFDSKSWEGYTESWNVYWILKDEFSKCERRDINVKQKSLYKL